MSEMSKLIDRILKIVGPDQILKEHLKIFCLCSSCRVQDICKRYNK